MTSADKRERIEQFEQACRRRGLPVTTQRRVVFDSILDRKDHPTADQMYEQVKARLPGLSRTTVYRILDTLVELGMITKTCHPGSSARFDPAIQRHHHLVCTHCETIIDIEEKTLDAVAWPDVRATGFEINDFHIHFRGICAECRGKLKKGGGESPSSKPPARPTRKNRKKQAHGKARTTK